MEKMYIKLTNGNPEILTDEVTSSHIWGGCSETGGFAKCYLSVTYLNGEKEDIDVTQCRNSQEIEEYVNKHITNKKTS